MQSECMTQEEIYEALRKNDKGKPSQTIGNCVFVLEQDEQFRGKIRFNILSERDSIVRDVGWPRNGSAITDRDMSYLKLYLEQHYQLNQEKHLRDAIRIVAGENRFHPIRDYLEGLQWDKTPRIAHALAKYLGAEECRFNYECLKVFMLGAISRVFQPGIKFELMLCLVGGQGAGKSTFFRLLAVRDEWFTDDLKRIDDENVYRKMQGHWIIEMSEMLATANAKSIEDIRGFISRQKETYKVPYEVHPEDRLRQCVFAGTSNSLDFLPLDRAGNRRFLPIMVDPNKAETHILENEKESRAYIDQMWAEAMVIYRSGDYRLALPSDLEEEARIRQKEFMPEDTVTGRIQSYLESLKEDYVCSRQIFELGLGRFGEPKQWEIREINDIMNNSMEGWERGPHRRIPGYGTQRTWRRKAGVAAENLEQLALPEGW